MNNSMQNVKIDGLVLEGGAMRGMYTAGILDTLIEAGIESKSVVGVSAGALFGVNYLSKQVGRVVRYNKRFNSDKNYLGIKPLVKEGNIVDTDYAYRRVPHELDPFDDETFKASDGKFTAVVTNIDTAEAEYIPIESVFDQMDTLRASGSMPVVSRPVEIDGKKYLDGAISDSVPFEWMLETGAQKVVVVLTRDITYVKKPWSPLICNFYKRKYPLFSAKMADRHNLYNGQIERLKELEKEGRVFIIRPSQPITISRTESNPDKLQSVYELGISDMKKCMDDLVKYLEK